jgi:hypothetical protein
MNKKGHSVNEIVTSQIKYTLKSVQQEKFTFDSLAEISLNYKMNVDKDVLRVDVDDISYLILSQENSSTKQIAAWADVNLANNTAELHGFDYYRQTGARPSTVNAMLVNDEVLVKTVKSIVIDREYIEKAMKKELFEEYMASIERLAQRIKDGFGKK